MAYGEGADDAALDAAWQAFCERLKAAGTRAFKSHNPATPVQRADAFRFLTQNLGQAFDLALETKDPRFPWLHPFCTPMRKLGGDCADFTYRQAWIDGRSVYRISGRRGTARFLNFTVQGPRPAQMPNGAPPLHEPFGDVPESNLFGHQLEVAEDGSFELLIGGARRGANWLPTTSGTRKLFVREGFDRWDETPTLLRIERVDLAEPRPLPRPAEMIGAMEWAGDFIAGMMDDWPDWSFAHGGVNASRPNRFPDASSDAADTKRGRAATAMAWSLAPDEALIVTFDAHAGLWMLTNAGMFGNSMDFLYRPVGYTPSRSAVDADGRIRMILAHDDPGYRNWIDTQGFAQGMLTYRHMLEGAPVPLETQVVAFAELAAALPADCRKATAAERTAELRARFAGVRQRYGS